MKTHFLPHSPIRVAAAGALIAAAQCAWAGPGAHGPNGEHLDAPASTAPAAGTRPRLEAHTESFELTATLNARELTIFIDRYDTNAPVLKATVEVESGGKKAAARFQADQGTYTVEDAAFLALLAAPGDHALVFTVTAGEETDLLDGTLNAPPEAEAAGGASRLPEIGLASLGLGVVVAAAMLWRRRRSGLRFAATGGVR